MKFTEKQLEKLQDLDMNLSVLSGLLHFAIKENDKDMFAFFYSDAYLSVVKEFEDTLNIGYIDMEIEYFAISLGICKGFK